MLAGVFYPWHPTKRNTLWKVILEDGCKSCPQLRYAGKADFGLTTLLSFWLCVSMLSDVHNNTLSLSDVSLSLPGVLSQSEVLHSERSSRSLRRWLISLLSPSQFPADTFVPYPKPLGSRNLLLLLYPGNMGIYPDTVISWHCCSHPGVLWTWKEESCHLPDEVFYSPCALYSQDSLTCISSPFTITGKLLHYQCHSQEPSCLLHMRGILESKLKSKISFPVISYRYFDFSWVLHSFLLNSRLYIRCIKLGLCLLISVKN